MIILYVLDCEEEHETSGYHPLSWTWKEVIKSRGVHGSVGVGRSNLPHGQESKAVRQIELLDLRVKNQWRPTFTSRSVKLSNHGAVRLSPNLTPTAVDLGISSLTKIGRALVF